MVEELNRICSATGLDRCLAIGAYVLDTLFGGDHAAFRRRKGRHLTFRALARRKDLGVSYVQIWRAVNILDQVRDLPPEVATALPPTHHALLLGVHDLDQKVALARRAVEQSWTCSALSAAVRATRDASPRHAGRRAIPDYLKALHRCRDYVQATHFTDIERVDDLNDAEAEVVAGIAADMRSRSDEVEARLKLRAETRISLMKWRARRRETE